jgi:hypothetical protein
MFKPRSYLRPFAFLLTGFAILGATQAQAVQRTHVSAAFGSDSNTATNCTAAAPCRFFQAAMTVTDNNGEVIVLDSGGYGAVTITQSVALIAPPGVYAGISVFPGASGVTIATPGVNVVLRGLSINGQGGNNGINMTAGNSLSVENLVISNLTQNAILVNAVATVNVTDTIIRRNAVNGIYLQNGAKSTITRAEVSGSASGIRVEGATASTTTTADIADTTLDGNTNGVNAFSLNVTPIVRVSVRDSRVVRNSQFGLAAASIGTGVVTLSASNNIVSNNGSGIEAQGDAGAKVFVSGNTITTNAVGMRTNNVAVIESAGNNTIRGNTTVDVSGTITSFGGL